MKIELSYHLEFIPKPEEDGSVCYVEQKEAGIRELAISFVPNEANDQEIKKIISDFITKMVVLKEKKDNEMIKSLII